MSPDVKVDSIADDLRQRIIDGEYGTAGRLPPLRMLAEEYQTTNETMNKAVQLLQAEGMIYSQGRTGLFVRGARTRVPGLTARFDLFLEKQKLIAVEEYVEPPALVPASAQIAEMFHIPESTPVVRRYRRQGTPNVPYRLVDSYFLEELAGGEILEQMQRDVSFDVLEAIRKKHHQIIRPVHEDVFARLPTAEEQDSLNIVRHTPVLEMLRTNFSANQDGLVIMFSRLIFVGYYFELSYNYEVDHWMNS